MKYVQSITFRALSALALGLLLIAFPTKTTSVLVIIIGVLFLLPGLVSIAAYFRLRSQSDAMRPLFPLVGVGSLLFGMLLIICSASLVVYMRYVLAAFLLLAGVSQIVSLMGIKKYASVPAFYYVVAVLVSLAGIVFFIFPEWEDKLVYTILGVTSMIYGLVELIQAIHFRKVRRLMVAAGQKTNEEEPEQTTDEPQQIEHTENEEPEGATEVAAASQEAQEGAGEPEQPAEPVTEPDALETAPQEEQPESGREVIDFSSGND